MLNLVEVDENFVLGGRVRLIQPVQGYKAAIDPILLAAAVDARKGQTVLDVGTGVGTAALALAVRVHELQIAGLELQTQLAELARRNAVLNDQGNVTIITGDLMEPPTELTQKSFDHVLTNPPYMKVGTYTVAAHGGKALANGEQNVSLAEWLNFCARRLKSHGTLTLIHRADRVDEILAHLHGRFGGVVLFPLWSKAGQPAHRVLVSARKGSKSPARLSAGLVVHREDGRYTDEAEAVLRGMAPLVL